MGKSGQHLVSILGKSGQYSGQYTDHSCHHCKWLEGYDFAVIYFRERPKPLQNGNKLETLHEPFLPGFASLTIELGHGVEQEDPLTNLHHPLYFRQYYQGANMHTLKSF